MIWETFLAYYVWVIVVHVVKAIPATSIDLVLFQQMTSYSLCIYYRSRYLLLINIKEVRVEIL
jgi:hypothetical protein